MTIPTMKQPGRDMDVHNTILYNRKNYCGNTHIILENIDEYIVSLVSLMKL